MFEIFDHVPPPSIEDCHLTTFPVCPLNVKSPLLVPEHAVVLPPTEPPTDCAWASIPSGKANFITKKRTKSGDAFFINKCF